MAASPSGVQGATAGGAGSGAAAGGGRGRAQAQDHISPAQQGFTVRTDVTDPDEATTHAEDVAASVSLAADAFQVTTIGPGWGQNVTNRSESRTIS